MAQLYYGGDIITMESKEDIAEAVVVDNGVIKYVGSYDEAEKLLNFSDKNEKINLEGKTLMPSFIDPHGHISMVAQFSAFCDLSECVSFSQIVEKLNKFKEDKNVTSDEIIVGYGYDHNFLEEHCHPNKYVLNQVSLEIPILILHTSCHMGVVNSALMTTIGLTDESKDPEGGHFGRDDEGKLNGYVEESPALAMIMMPLAKRMQGDFIQQMKDAQDIYLENGITTVQDGATSIQSLLGLTAVAKMNEYKIDVVSYVMTDNFEEAIEKYHEYLKKYNNRFKIGGAKIVLDGSPQGKSAWLSKPYEGEKEYCGYPTHKTEEVFEAAKSAIKDNHQLLAHCNGDAASEQFIDSYEKAVKELKDVDLKKLRPVMIHCQTVREDQLDRMADLNMIPSFFVAHTYYWGDIHLVNLGEKRGSQVSPVKSALERGLVYNFHQDPPVVKPKMLHTVWCAVNRETISGKPIGKNQCIDVYDALKGVTINAAYEYFEEDTKGSLKAGKKADMVILDKNPLKVEKEQIADIAVVKTIKEGKVLFER